MKSIAPVCEQRYGSGLIQQPYLTSLPAEAAHGERAAMAAFLRSSEALL
jgi:hypothetical protein